MCSCFAKVTAPPPPPTDTHKYTHPSYPDSIWLCQNVLCCNLVDCSWGWLRDRQRMWQTNVVLWLVIPHTPSYKHLWCCQATFSFCKRFTVPASDSLTAMQPRCQSPAGAQLPHTDQKSKSFIAATSLHVFFSFLTAITQCKQLMMILAWV